MVARKKTKPKSTTKKSRQTKHVAKTKGRGKSARSKTRKARRRQRSKVVDTPGIRSEVRSGDLQGLSRAEIADSESVDELLEDGDAFEAGLVDGVENAKDPDVSEVTAREVPEDDVPAEYLDRDD